jgi:hypothetical protein
MRKPHNFFVVWQLSACLHLRGWRSGNGHALAKTLTDIASLRWAALIGTLRKIYPN